jgi:hypothetical protein
MHHTKYGAEFSDKYHTTAPSTPGTHRIVEEFQMKYSVLDKEERKRMF